MPQNTIKISPQEALVRTIEHREIFHDEMLHSVRLIMKGDVSPVMMAALITGLRVKKESIGEITAAATVMRELSTKVHVPPPHEHFVDIVGTGGDGHLGMCFLRDPAKIVQALERFGDWLNNHQPD